MLPATISTSVAPETINKVTRLFNGSVTDIVSTVIPCASSLPRKAMTPATR